MADLIYNFHRRHTGDFLPGAAIQELAALYGAPVKRVDKYVRVD
jgi:hypothetical protein